MQGIDLVFEGDDLTARVVEGYVELINRRVLPVHLVADLGADRGADHEAERAAGRGADQGSGARADVLFSGRGLGECRRCGKQGDD